MASIEQKHFITSFVRSNECRIKCGDDNSDDVLPSTLFDDLREVSIVHRSCGCRMVPAKRMTPIEKFQQNHCFKLEYFFARQSAGARSYSVCCLDCRSRLYSNEDDVYRIAEYHIHDTEIPIDLCPTTMFFNCFIGEVLNHANRYRSAPDCWLCRFCGNDLYSFYNCQYSEVETEDDEPVCNMCVDGWICMDPDCPSKENNVDLNCDESMDFDNLYPDASHFQDLFRQMNNNTPTDQKIMTTYVNSYITDSDLEERLDDYYDDRRVSPDLLDEAAYLEYNGYY